MRGLRCIKQSMGRKKFLCVSAFLALKELFLGFFCYIILSSLHLITYVFQFYFVLNLYSQHSKNQNYLQFSSTVYFYSLETGFPHSRLARDLQKWQDKTLKLSLFFFFCLPPVFLPVVGLTERWWSLLQWRSPAMLLLGRHCSCGCIQRYYWLYVVYLQF